MTRHGMGGGAGAPNDMRAMNTRGNADQQLGALQQVRRPAGRAGCRVSSATHVARGRLAGRTDFPSTARTLIRWRPPPRCARTLVGQVEARVAPRRVRRTGAVGVCMGHVGYARCRLHTAAPRACIWAPASHTSEPAQSPAAAALNEERASSTHADVIRLVTRSPRHVVPQKAPLCNQAA